MISKPRTHRTAQRCKQIYGIPMFTFHITEEQWMVVSFT